MPIFIIIEFIFIDLLFDTNTKYFSIQISSILIGIIIFQQIHIRESGIQIVVQIQFFFRLQFTIGISSSNLSRIQYFHEIAKIGPKITQIE